MRKRAATMPVSVFAEPAGTRASTSSDVRSWGMRDATSYKSQTAPAPKTALDRFKMNTSALPANKFTKRTK